MFEALWRIVAYLVACSCARRLAISWAASRALAAASAATPRARALGPLQAHKFKKK